MTTVALATKTAATASTTTREKTISVDDKYECKIKENCENEKDPRRMMRRNKKILHQFQNCNTMTANDMKVWTLDKYADFEGEQVTTIPGARPMLVHTMSKLAQ